MNNRVVLLAGMLVTLTGTTTRFLGQSIYEPYTFTTLAGSAGYGSTDGPKEQSRFNSPSGLAFDKAGNLYVADRGNHTIRKMFAVGTVKTLAGQPSVRGNADGKGNDAQFSFPSGLAVSSNGTVFVADSGNNLIRAVSPEGDVTTVAGSRIFFEPPTDGVGSNARFHAPVGIVLDDDGSIYVADSGHNLIRKITPDGVVSTLAGSTVPATVDGKGRAASFAGPTGIAMEPAGTLIVADAGGSTIRRVTLDGMVTTLAGTTNQPIWSIPPAGSKDGLGSNAEFYSPSSLVVDSNGIIYVSDSGNNTIRRITPAGLVTTLAGLAGKFGHTDGTGSEARFYVPSGLAINANGDIYTADAWNNAIRKITSTGKVTTFAGISGGTGVADGFGSNARFNAPAFVAIDRDANVFVTKNPVPLAYKETVEKDHGRLETRRYWQSGGAGLVCGKG